jgi:FRG domain
MPRTPRWTAEPIRDGVGVVHLSRWAYYDDFVRQEMLDYRSYVWRGQASASWPLEPTLDRVLRARKQLGDASIRDEHLLRFKLSTRGRRGVHPAPLTASNDWWALGQHYGLATPLLDWTTSPYVAAYFAFIPGVEAVDDRCAIWALGRFSVAQKSMIVATLYDGDDRPPVVEFLEPLSDENSRLTSQGGLFTRSPDGLPLEEWVRTHFRGDTQVWRLVKITIPASDRALALRSLNRMNINHLSLYPDLYGASRYSNVHLVVENY